MHSDYVDAQLAAEAAAAVLERAAQQFSRVADALAHGDASQDLLRAARTRLQQAAVAYAAAVAPDPPRYPELRPSRAHTSARNWSSCASWAAVAFTSQPSLW